VAEAEEGEEGEEEVAEAGGSYDYLLSMPMYSLTAEKVAALQAEAEQQEAEVARLRNLTGKDMWADDLELFLQVRGW
jgi:DNA topoisomerase-2